MWQKIKTHYGWVIAIIWTVWINFFPDTRPLEEVSTMSPMTAHFNVHHPLHDYVRIGMPLFFAACFLYIWWKRRDSSDT